MEDIIDKLRTAGMYNVESFHGEPILKVPLSRMYVLSLIFCKHEYDTQIYDSPIRYTDCRVDSYDSEYIYPKPVIVYNHSCSNDGYYTCDESSPVMEYLNPATSKKYYDMDNSKDVQLFKSRLMDSSPDITIKCSYD
jgi:hypothetical protein